MLPASLATLVYPPKVPIPHPVLSSMPLAPLCLLSRIDKMLPPCSPPCSPLLPQIDKMFQVVHTDPWLWGDKHRTSRTISLMNNRSSGEGRMAV